MVRAKRRVCDVKVMLVKGGEWFGAVVRTDIAPWIEIDVVI